MSERQRSLARIVRLQETMQTLAAARLAAADARKAEVVAQRESLQAYLANAELTGRLAVHAIATTRALVAREAAAETERATLALARQKVETKLKLAERLSDEVARADAEAAERKALERMIEEAVGRDPEGP